MKRYILIAGVNGAGKSTLYQSSHIFQGIPRINSDDILKGNGDWRNLQDQIRAGKEAVRLQAQFLDQGITFQQETTLCGKSILQAVRKAKNQGYQIEIHFVGLDNSEIAKRRVRYRVSVGGHGVPDKLIEKRYHESFSKIRSILPICDRVIFYDNSDLLTWVADCEFGVMVREAEKLPIWFQENILLSRNQ